MPAFPEALLFVVLVLAAVGALAIIFAATTFTVAQVRLNRMRARDALARRLWTIAQHAVSLARAEAGESIDVVNVPLRAKVLMKVMIAELRPIHAAVGIGSAPAALDSWLDGLLHRVMADDKRNERAKKPALREVPAPAETAATGEEKAS